VVFRTIGDQTLQPGVHGGVAVTQFPRDRVSSIGWRVEQRVEECFNPRPVVDRTEG